MLQVISRLSLMVIFSSVFFHPYAVFAQVAPTSSAAISGSVSDSIGKPVAHATVSLSGPKSASTQTDAQGLFVFVGVPFGTYDISAVAVGLGTATRTKLVIQGDTNVAIQYEPSSVNGLKTIAQVSTSANARFNVTPASITQVNPMAEAFSGVTSWRRILEQIPGVSQAGLLNGTKAQASIPTSPIVPMQISINGALPYETAVLIDDMPLIASPLGTNAGTGTDLNFYPLNGFGSADVVRGPGAAAPSIVNSIGGSFLLHAPGAVNTNHYEFSVSNDPYGGIVANALAAVRWKKLSVTVTYGANDSPGPISSAGIPTNSTLAFVSVNGQSFSPYSPCTPSTCFFGAFLFDPKYATGSNPRIAQERGFLFCCINQTSAWTQHTGSIALNYAISPTLDAEVYYTGQRASMPLPYQNYTTYFLPPSGYAGPLQAGQYLLGTIGMQLNPLWTVQASSMLEEKITAQIGRGQLRIAALQNRTFSGNGLTSPTALTLQLYGGGTLGGTAALFNGNSYQLCSNPSTNCATGTFGAPIAVNGFNVVYPFFSDYAYGATNNRDLLVSYATPIGQRYHAGFSFVKSYYNNPQTFIESLGAPYNENLYGDCGRAPATSETTNEVRLFAGGNLSDRTSLDLSMYFADADYHVPNPLPPETLFVSGGITNIVIYPTPSAYTDARYTYAAPRVGFVWRPTAAVALRAAAGGGFAEAPLGDLVGAPPGSTTPICGATSCTISLANTNLQPEKSFSFDVGADIRFHNSTLVSLDMYRSNLYGQIYNSTTVGPPCATCGALPVYTTQYGNLGLSRFEGVLVDIRHDVPRGVYWALSGGLTRGYLVSVPAGFYNTSGGTCNLMTGVNCKNVAVVPNINFNGEFAASIPYSQALGTLGYRWNPEKYVDLTGTYYGNNNSYFRPAFVEIDGHLNYPIAKNISLLATFANITGIYDQSVQAFAPGTLIGAPTIAGLPYALMGEEYGPRTVLVTTNVRL